MPSFFIVHCPLSIARGWWFIVIVKYQCNQQQLTVVTEVLCISPLTNG